MRTILATTPLPSTPTPPVERLPWPMPPTLSNFTFEVPASAKVDPHTTSLVNDIPEDHEGMQEHWEKADGSIPDAIRDPMYKYLNTKVNNLVFRSRPGGAPQPLDASAWHFSAFGDFGNGTRAMRDVIKNIKAWKPEFVVSAGDQVYPDSSASNWESKLDPPEQFGGLASTVPFIPNMGNHDMKPTAEEYFKRFPYVEGGRYFKASYKNVDMFSVDSNQPVAPGSPQHAWLEQALKDSKAAWKIVQVHHPMMSVLSKFHYKETSRLPGDLGPLLAKYGVDLLVAGHEHWYERSRPLNEAGTLQVTVGGGGGALYPFFYPQQKWSETRDVDFGHVDFEVRGDNELVGRYRTRDGRVEDTFTIPNRTPAGWKAGDPLVGGAAPVSVERPPVANGGQKYRNPATGPQPVGVPNPGEPLPESSDGATPT
ncbi:MAG: metallophosphoesterase [Thermoleophilia bacterium]|nr:metallophosphoesterase [Thermoleophilia bacterium]